MNDLIVRLRGEGGIIDIPEIMHEAADEIERLREALGQIEEWTGEYSTGNIARAALNIQQRASE